VPALRTPQKSDHEHVHKQRKISAPEREEEELKRKNSATLELLEETERLVNEKRGRFARPRSGTVCFASTSAALSASSEGF
jgi:hypothetical protein